MKKLIVFAICLLTLTNTWAFDEGYQKAMKKNLQAFKEAQSKEALQAVANAFERVANNESKEWLPLYYTALIYINMSQKEEGLSAKDAALDKSRIYLDKALSIAPNESELVLLEGYWNMIKLSFDPSSRGQSLSEVATQLFDKAITLDPENPRAYLFKAYMEFGTAQYFGSSTEGACTMAKKSLALFEKTKTKEEISPSWGKDQAQYLAGECK